MTKKVPLKIAIAERCRAESAAGERARAQRRDHPFGRYALVPDLGADRVFIDRFDRTTHALSREDGTAPLVQRISSGGDRPLGFAIDSSGKWLLVANQRSGKVNVFSIDPVTGKVSYAGQSADIALPTSIAFVK